jgi:hypothetical protein
VKPPQWFRLLTLDKVPDGAPDAHQPEDSDGDSDSLRELLVHLERNGLPTFVYYMTAIVTLGQAIMLGIAIFSLT